MPECGSLSLLLTDLGHAEWEIKSLEVSNSLNIEIIQLLQAVFVTSIHY